MGKPRKISPQADLTLFRAAQETINNANKHSNASKVALRLDYSDTDFVSLEAVDDGIGSDDIEKGFGLIGIQERVRLLNGSAEISTSVGKGFKILIRLPGQYEH